MRKLHDRQSRCTQWRQSGVQHWRLQFSGLIHCLFYIFFLFWGTKASAQTDSVQSTNAAYRKAEVFFQASDWVNATTEFKKLSENPISAEAANYRLATIHQKIGKNNEALFYIDQALKLNPSEDTYVILKAQLLSGLYKFNEAGKYYFKAIELNPKYWSRYKEASDFFKYSHNSFDLLKICRLWEKQFLFRPEIAKAYIWAYQDLKKIDSIVFVYEKLNAKYPDQPEYYKELKSIYLNSNQFAKAQNLIIKKYQFDTSSVFYKNEIIQIKAIALLGFSQKQDVQSNHFNSPLYFKLYNENKYQILEILNSKLYFLRAFKEPWSELQNSSIGIFFQAEQNVKLIDSVYKLAINHGYPNYEIKRKLNETLGNKFYCSSNYNLAVHYYESSGELKMSNENEVIPYLYSLFAIQNKEKILLVKPKLIDAFPFAPINELVNCYTLLFESKYEELNTIIANLLRTRNMSNSWKNEFICLNLLGNINLKVNPNSQLENFFTENINAPYLKLFLNYFQSQSNEAKTREILNLAYNLGQISQLEFQTEISKFKK